ncbi:hypothetical protein [Streptomyces sp. S.PNR 29]|uniref:hypothetical protein n=1 Tax=Streptomyces sp. S.PNR 29 TaxID=2973805 RepID=UPI0025B1C934|nr:hypothetical protein [Streptomyces sp. S.PNR 29]MDN0194733.1 hypothetical protein [Streptomyces sp. S.PNR 29]
MAEHDSDREDREPDEKGVPFDEEAAWAAIVAGYGEEPPDPPGTKPFKSIEDLALLESGKNDSGKNDSGQDDSGHNDSDKNDPGHNDSGNNHDAEHTPEDDKPAAAGALGSSVSFAPGVGPRDYTTPEPSDDDFGEDDEGHFVPPEPPPLPTADTTAKFAWLAVIGGPVLLLLAVLLGWDMTWWLATLGIGGFLGGFATLVARMKPGDEDDDDPGRGAVV